MTPLFPVSPSSDALAPDGLDRVLSMVAGLPVPMIVHERGEQGTIRLVNDSFVQCFGYTLEDIPTLGRWATLAFRDTRCRDLALTQWWQAIRDRKNAGVVLPPFEGRIHAKDASQRDVLVGFSLLDDLVFVTLQDLTGTHAAQQALTHERRLNEHAAFALTENIPAGTYSLLQRAGTTRSEVLFVSRQYLNMLGVTLEQAMADPLIETALMHPEDREGWRLRDAEAYANKSPFSAEARIIVNDEIRWIRAESAPRELDDGSCIWEGVLVDITRLKETEARLKTVLDAARAFTWKLDLKKQLLQVDESWGAANGVERGSRVVHFDDWARDLHPDDYPVLMVRYRALAEGKADLQSGVYRRRNRDGQWVWLQVHTGVSERDAEGKPMAISGVSFDISAEMTARAKAKEEQAQLREDLQRAQQRDTVAQVAGGVAHDLNNLIAVVAGTAEILSLQAEGQPALEDGLARIRRSIGMAHDLIAGLGGLVRPDLPREFNDLCKLMRNAVDLLGQRRLAQNSVRLLLPDECPPVWANPTEVAQVIVNLAINACDSGGTDHPAQVTLQVHPPNTLPPPRQPDVGVAPSRDDSVAIFSVSDTGLGLSDAVRARMFRANFTTKGKAGTGLGLLIVSTILQGNRAALWVDSGQGLGTTMTIAWPTTRPAPGVADMADRAIAKDASTALTAQDMLSGYRVLVVDDLPDVAEVLADMLESAGATAVALSDPMEAAEALAEAPEIWSALVTDLHMPGMDGRALAQHAAALSTCVPTVLVTARPDSLREGDRTDFCEVLSKPVTAAHLIRAVRQAGQRRVQGLGADAQ